MRRLGIGLACLALAACGKAPDATEPGDNVTGASGVAFDYGYELRIPSSRISAIQDRHASACERLGPARCRITGLTYSVDPAGTIAASLSIRIAAPLARAFGREAVAAAEAAGGALVGAEIVGTDALGAIEAAAEERRSTGEPVAALDRELARGDLPATERAELRSQRAEAAAFQEASAAAETRARASLATTPMSFAYAAGRGTGLEAIFADAGQSALASVGFTLAAALWVLANLGPPAILLLLLLFVWRRWGRRWSDRVFAAEPAYASPAVPPE